MTRSRAHFPGCACALPGCVAARTATTAPSRRAVLTRFETLLAMRDATVEVSPTFARVTADGYTLILPLDMAVTRLLSAADKLPPLTFGRPVTDTYAPRVTGERRRRNA